MDNLIGSNHPNVTALTRRGISPQVLMQQAPMMTQLTPGAPNYDPSMVPPPGAPMPNRSPMSGMQQSQAPQPVQQAQQAAPVTPPLVTEAERIVQALTKRLEMWNKIHTAQNVPPPAPAGGMQ